MDIRTFRPAIDDRWLQVLLFIAQTSGTLIDQVMDKPSARDQRTMYHTMVVVSYEASFANKA